MAMAVAVVVYFVFIRAPSAESLFEQARVLMKTDSEEKRKEARDGPVAALLSLYPEHEKTQVQAWADRVDREILEKQMLNRRNAKFAAESDAEKDFRLALDNEELGKLDLAGRLWGNLQKLKAEKDPEQRAWGLIGENYLKDLKAVDQHYNRLMVLLRSEEIDQKKPETESAFEEMALLAARAEKAGQWAKARDEWELLSKRTEAEPEQRRWHLLAIRQARELKSKD
jgi:hypothetical protein